MTTSNFSQNQQIVKAKTKEQIAEEMGMSLKTLQRRLKKVNLKIPRGLISPQKQTQIFERLEWLS